MNGFRLSVALLALGWAATLPAQIIRPIQPDKISEFDGKQLRTQELEGREFSVAPFRTREAFRTGTVPTRDFNHSSKNVHTRPAPRTARQVDTPPVPVPLYEKEQTIYPTRTIENKEAPAGSRLAPRVADKPVTDWWTLIRKEPPSGIPGRPSTGGSFSRWKLPEDDTGEEAGGEK